MNIARLGAITLILLSSLSPSEARADRRYFSYLYEPTLPREGEIELTQWVTSKVGKAGGQSYVFEFREEAEYGLTSRLASALYLNTAHRTGWTVNEEDEKRNEFVGVSSEWKYLLLRQSETLPGILGYAEFSAGPDEAEIEGKFVTGKRFGPWITALNLTYEPEWELDGSEKSLNFETALGISYRLSEKWSVGLEFQDAHEYEDNFEFRDEVFAVQQLGPVLAYYSQDFWANFTIFPQIHGTGEGSNGNHNYKEGEKWEARLLVGVEF